MLQTLSGRLSALFLTLAAPAAPAQFTPFQVADLNPGAASSDPEELTVVGGELFFAADDGAVGRELWRTDAAGPPVFVKETNTTGLSYIKDCTALGGLLLFAAHDGVNGYQLWRSDGSTAGTFALTTAALGTQDLRVLGTEVVFSKNDLTYGRELWKSDGSAAGTAIVANIRAGASSSGPFPVAVVGADYFFSADDGTGIGPELWKTDGTGPGTQLVEDIWPGLNPGLFPDGIAMNGILYFTGQDPDGRELWRSDGTAAGTWQVKDVRPGSIGSWPQHYTVSGGKLFFVADDGTHGIELWVSDGTTPGTTLVKDIYPGPMLSIGQGNPELTDVDGTLYLYAEDGTHGGEVWRSDGTEAGTSMVVDLATGSWNCDAGALTNVGGVLYFGGIGFGTGRELWRSDGTAAGTTLVVDLRPGGASGDPAELAVFGSRLYFTAEDGVSGRELWALDVCELQQPLTYCTPGTTASGCTATLGASGVPSASAPSGFVVTASAVEGDKDGLLFFGTNGAQANPWGNGNSFQCVVPPVKRTPVQPGVGTPGQCDGSFALDFNAFVTAFPNKAPVAGATVDLQCWFRDPHNTSNQTTSLSDALEFLVCP